MNKFEYIYENEDGFTFLDRYFDYLGQIKSSMPKVLYEFASDCRRYELLGEKTLHDSWINNLDISYTYESECSCKVKLNLKLAHLGNNLQLEYSGVIALRNLFISEFWPNRPVDLLTHEFTVTSDGFFKHVIEFDRGVWFEVTFSSFSYVEYDQ